MRTALNAVADRLVSFVAPRTGACDGEIVYRCNARNELRLPARWLFRRQRSPWCRRTHNAIVIAALKYRRGT